MKLKSSKVVSKNPVNKQVNKEVTPNEKRIAEIKDLISEKENTIFHLNMEIAELHKECLELEIYPYKLGDTVVAEVPAGKSRKKSNCILETDNSGHLYFRPFKNDGELSGRRFMLCPTNGKTYKDLFE